MLLFYLGQVPAQWFTESGDAALAGGILRFYEVGTSTPKAVYSDYQGVTAAGTSVTLDASGRANVFLDGLYSVTLEDSDNVQIGPKIDGVGNAALVGDGFVLSLLNYDDLRAFDGDAFRAAVLQGRIANGDGGAGLFVWDALETSADDGGTILAPTTLPASGRWVRIRGETVDPRWYGCSVDVSTADDAQFAIAAAAAVSLKARLHVENGYIRLSSNFSFPIGSNVSAGQSAGFVATSDAPTLTFPAGSRFSGSSACFGGTIQPLFAAGTVENIPLSWMGGASFEDRLDKWAASDNGARILLLDQSVTSSSLPTFAATSQLDVVPGSKITVSGTGQNLSVDVIYPGESQWLDWGSANNIGTVNVGNRACPVGWFGAVGDGVTFDSIPLNAAMKTGWMKLGFGKYVYETSVSLPNGLRMDGVIGTAISSGTVSSTSSTMPGSSLIMGGDCLMSSTSGNFDFNSIGFYSTGADVGVETGGKFSARNCVFGCWNGSGVAAASIETQDCYANSILVFLTAGDETTFYSNLRTNTDASKRYFRNGTSFDDIYHRNEVGVSADYDIVLTADNDDGLEVGKTALVLEEATADKLNLIGLNVADDGIKVVDLSGGGSYTVLDSDPAVIVISPGGADRTVTLPASAGTTCRMRFFVCNYTVNDAQVVFTGDLITQYSLPQTEYASSVRTAIFVPSLGKWAI